MNISLTPVALVTTLLVGIAVHVLPPLAHAQGYAPPPRPSLRPPSAQPGPPAADPATVTIRPAVATPVHAAQGLFREKKYSEALVRLDEADLLPMKTPQEIYVIERTRSAAAAGLGDNAMVAKSIEAVFLTGVYPPDEKRILLETLVTAYFSLKNHEKAVEWGERAVLEPGVSNNARLTLAQSAYILDKFPIAIAQLRLILDQAEKAGDKPNQSQLRLLASIALKQQDTATYEKLIEKLVIHHPSNEYWADLISRVYGKPEFPDRLIIDARRLRFSLGLVTDASEYAALAQLTLAAGLPTEAKKVLDEGYAKGIVQTSDAERAKLRDSINRELLEEKKQAANAAATATKAAQGLVNNGYNLVLQGQSEAGLAMMERGVAGTDLKYPEEARLRLGIAYVAAGQKQKAIDTFKAVKGSAGLVDLARVWALRASQIAG